ncbi:hypothetical protein [Pseudorhodobacter sp.]|uniref:hypothetical protein n=1 Tax=Pseudorhodobacter sp. TaxID=1934400 RepID=UPI002647D23B|nr:hypothetical protein [Pseudorhodobacter sp.]MDN5787462.1 hypothetical protein [Pseudorhodobacter sp.]
MTIEKRQELVARFRNGASVNTLSKTFGVTIRHINRVVTEERGQTKGRSTPSKTVAFRAPIGEIDTFLAGAAAVGITGSSQAFRVLLRMAAGLFELFPNQLDAFNRTVWLKGKELDLLNQLAKSVHRGKLRLSVDDRVLLAKSIDTNARLHEDLRGILDEAKSRRGYAVARLITAKEALR